MPAFIAEYIVLKKIESFLCGSFHFSAIISGLQYLYSRS